MIDEKSNIKIFTYLDWSDARCPCGAEISGRYCSSEEWQNFMDEHKSHSSGKSSRYYDAKDSLKVMTDVPERIVEDL